MRSTQRREYAGVRVQFGTPIAGHQLIQKNLADIEMAITTSRLLCYYALDPIDRDERANGTSAMAKRYSTTACEQAISLAMHIHGAMGISKELGSSSSTATRACCPSPMPPTRS